MLLTNGSITFLTGAVSVICVVLIPNRYQTTAGLSPLQAGARLTLVSVASPMGLYWLLRFVRCAAWPPSTSCL
ncbi:hypothetical protein F5Y07DRAFT_358479 [Xylaria sp. FL0933]|nr:hypothetical protein F5Y07DRAFT_358479 [Xylaria sp. FL0933]